mgnify:FL=1|tara:strand:- start:25 stop:693 length:669 start_codon:yes stop_codon:yes gene_type:complete
MSKYFRKLPNLNYPSLLKTRESNVDFVQTKNLFRRVKVREDLFGNFMQFEKYKVVGDERPDNVAEKVYDNDDLDWVILLSNNIIDIKNDWPLTQSQFNEFVNEKYTPQQLVSIHHYETLELRDNKNQLILPAGITVDENFNMEYLSGGQIRSTNSLIDGRPIRAVTFFDFENDLNDRKRNINVLKPDLLGVFIKDFERVMKYDKSSQYVNRKLKQTENPRIK